ncbi:mitochondrial putative 4-hydroxy-2-oxoglutarate aldolase [Calycina marina]|uniref:Mitochondrial putative 4-hydroxy-2-oxoglutarate aldolase n=1 Tax=Calycina marina TaxID=1763456 RepID=A0A9P7Z1Y7_9HELO|nr:mitochondrial putative 4-hydroxy-2-oxoglutarate aldolase [Calycina marina]
MRSSQSTAPMLQVQLVPLPRYYKGQAEKCYLTYVPGVPERPESTLLSCSLRSFPVIFSVSSPYNDARSPAGSFSQNQNLGPFRAGPHSALHNSSNNSVYSKSLLSKSQYGSSYSTSSVGVVENMRRYLVPGVYVPTVCFFDPVTEDLDTATIATHAVRLAKAGVTGLTTQGSNGEAVHLTHSEREKVTAVTRAALTEAGFPNMPIIVGCGTQSTRETVQYCRDAYSAGGDYALILPPAYYASLFAPDSASVVKYFTAVADQSPIPIVIYNYPGAVSGMDLSSDVIVKLSAHPNIVGVKLTCGNTGKLNRIVAATKSPKTASSGVPPFIVLGGSADFTLQSLIGGGHGILAGLANIAPKSCLEILRLYRERQVVEAQNLQEVIARGDWMAIQGGILSTKSGMESWLGYGGYARSPLPRPTEDQAAKWKEGFRELVALEKSL